MSLYVCTACPSALSSLGYRRNRHSPVFEAQSSPVCQLRLDTKSYAMCLQANQAWESREASSLPGVARSQVTHLSPD